MVAEVRRIAVQRTDGERAIVAKGLAKGERVVTAASCAWGRRCGCSSPSPAAEAVVNFCELFIRRPVMTTLVMAGILIFGIVAYRLLPVSDLPNVDFPTIQVTAELPGASPETMASAVATPLEKQFSTIAGLDSMTSSSALGATQITLQFALDRNLDAAAQDVQAAIAAGGAPAAAGHADAAVVPQGEPGRLSRSSTSRSPRRRCRSRRSTSTPRPRSRSASR